MPSLIDIKRAELIEKQQALGRLQSQLAMTRAAVLERQEAIELLTEGIQRDRFDIEELASR